MNKYREMIHENMDELIAFRRELHRFPESSLKEFETTDRICRELDKLGIAYKRMQPTGVQGEIKGTKGESDHIVLLRSDMDALEVLECTGLEFASENVGRMHACGHDTHMTNLLGAVKFLNAHPEEFAGTVRFIFQPAEEVAAGAKLMIEQGVMEGVDRAVGMHISPIFPYGTVSAMEGECWASCDRFKITVHGKSSHGANPHEGHDALVAASAIVMGLQPLISRETNPNSAAVLTVGSIVSGTRFNVVAGDAVMEGTSRCFSRELHAALPDMMRRVIENIAVAYGCTAELEFTVLTDVLYCDPETTRLGMASVAKVVGAENALTAGPQMVAEDFCYYTNHAKSVFFNLGARVADDSKVFPLHSDHVVFDERAIEIGISVFVQTAIDLLDALNAE
ncbi:MAG: amidohydrolase [Oscillospiraceae bacterium]|nr:amidohydrolase [Oscillospiraceae bacterium]